MKCQKCLKEFKEKEIDVSHDIPKYMGGTDADGRHNLCKECHLKYENEVMKLAFMNLVVNLSEKRKEICRNSARIVKTYFFKGERGNGD